jgi:outer membrane protein TolC
MLRLFVTSCILAAAAPGASAQISFTTAIDLALRNNPKVRMAQADVDKAQAQLAELHAAYLPNLIGGAGLAYSYGAPLGQPTLFSVTSQSLVFNYSQHDYIRAARAGLSAANFALKDARQQVEEDAAITYLSLDCAQQRKAAILQQYDFANRLVSIVQARLDAGQDSTIELLRARRTAAQIHLQLIHLDDDVASYSDHLARMASLPGTPLSTLPDSIPPLVVPASSSAAAAAAVVPDSPVVQAAFANAQAKRLQAFGDSRYLWRPQVFFVAEYSRFSNINNYSTYYPAFGSNTLNAAAIGVQIQVPVFDHVHQDKARESSADATHAENEAISARNQLFEGRLKLRHALSELEARADLATIDREIAQNQLDALLVQLQSAVNGGGTLMTPRDEQNARIQERQKYLDLLDADFQLRQSQINLLRQNGQLEDWLKSAAQAQGQSPAQIQVQPQANALPVAP